MSQVKTILLINPWIHDFSAYDLWTKPLGLLYLAAFLRRNGFNIQFIDCLDPWNPQMRGDSTMRLPSRLPSGRGKYFRETIPKPAALKNIPKRYHRYGLTPRVFREMLLALPKPAVVMVTSMMTYWYPGVFETIGVVQEIMPGVPIVLGGNYATLCPQHAATSGADFIFPGYGEEKLTKFMGDLFHLEIPFQPDENNLDSYPAPAYDLISRPEQIPLRTSRGCPFACSYCASDILNSRFQRRDPDKVFAEIASCHRDFQVRHFSLYDDAFLVHPREMAIPLLRRIIDSRLPVRFHCPNGLHLSEINEEMAGLMYQAGFQTIRFGFETADVRRQCTTGGKVSNSDLMQAVKYLVKAGYQKDEIGVYLLCGLPEQAAAEVRESIAFVQACGARPILAEYSPIPGTALWDEAVKVSPFDIATEPLYHNNSLLPCQSADFTLEMYRDLKSLTLL